MAIQIYERDHMLWVRLPDEDVGACQDFSMDDLYELYESQPEFLNDYFSVENTGGDRSTPLTANAVYTKGQELQPDAKRGKTETGNTKSESGLPPGSWYVSSILQGNVAALGALLACLPFPEPPLLVEAGAVHGPNAWLFCGRHKQAQNQEANKKEQQNKGPATEPKASAQSASTNKRKAGGMIFGDEDDDVGAAAVGALRGRAEHTDDVDHSGTWHVQLAGTKTWYIRPLETAHEWGGAPPKLNKLKGADKGPRGGWRFRIDTQQGDLFIINTRIWWHRTELMPDSTGDGLSVSVARDFYLPEAGDDGEGEAEGDEVEGEGDQDSDCEVLSNGSGLDPRLYAKRPFRAGDTVCEGEDIPEALAASAEPNCELVEEDGDQFFLRAIKSIHPGDPLSVARREGADYAAYELDLATGEMVEIENEEDGDDR